MRRVLLICGGLAVLMLTVACQTGGLTSSPTATFTPAVGTTALRPNRCTCYFFEMGRDWEGADLCPQGPPTSSRMAEQAFQGGWMLWTEQPDLVYVLPGSGDLPPEAYNPHSIFENTWSEGDPACTPSLEPPAGLFQPTRGFGKVWRENPQVRQDLGWATAPEEAYTGLYQCSRRRDSWEGETYCYVQSLEGRVIALVQYRRGRHWGFVRGAEVEGEER